MITEFRPRSGRSRAETDAEKEACWQAYLDGERSAKVLAQRFRHSVNWVDLLVRHFMATRQFGPETKWEHADRMCRVEYDQRERARLWALTEPD